MTTKEAREWAEQVGRRARGEELTADVAREWAEKVGPRTPEDRVDGALEAIFHLIRMHVGERELWRPLAGYHPHLDPVEQARVEAALVSLGYAVKRLDDCAGNFVVRW